MRLAAVIALGFLAACASAEAPAPAPDTPVRSLGEILEQSPASDWRTVDQDNLIYMQLPRGRVIIELAADYTPNHAANIRALARAHYWDGAAIVRSQDNYVVQWGRDEADPRPMGEGVASLAPEFDRPRAGVDITRLVDPDSYAREVGFAYGFPVASNGQRTWLTHCYGMVGAGRGDTADSGSGAELYVVIGQAPRHLDRNITTVGRVLQGMELLSVMPRGTGPLGFYETPQERTAIASIRLGSELPESERVNFEALRTDSATFRDVIESRRFRRESWFLDPVGHVNVCNVQLPVRVRQ
ncbi:MAG TPA: peptidylprolyl isomerase [Vitreimonas sp.]|uniref:peptidylprolyl isomerase n=1 Tax=Vitreimonas sp. TaxID=3069702 RepID=UPI002D722F96|nr:peptidylprolyl isomerase [Vitreimonas sp.]HYD88464.1 peptidylprolyl isomerase [Vitreimonas sp.]